MELTHLGIIPDGNRRYSRRLFQHALKGHEAGAERFREVLDWVREEGVKHVSIFALSWENISKRSDDEINHILDIFEAEIDILLEDKKIDEEKVKIQAIGRWRTLRPSLVQKLQKLIDKTKDHDGFFVTVALAYGGRQHLLDTVNNALQSKKSEMTEDTFAQLHTKNTPPLDMIIRTGGERRLSNFMLWQSAYAELYFIDKMWPELEKKDVKTAIEEFKRRKRRFGE